MPDEHATPAAGAAVLLGDELVQLVEVLGAGIQRGDAERLEELAGRCDVVLELIRRLGPQTGEVADDA